MGHKSKSEGPRDFTAPARLAKLRKAKKLSQQDLADATGMTKASVSRIESGDQNYDAEFLHLAARRLGCDVWELFHEGEKADPLADELRQVMERYGVRGR
jgi:transcriptional regulator with XRE-family HTH domain